MDLITSTSISLTLMVMELSGPRTRSMACIVRANTFEALFRVFIECKLTGDFDSIQGSVVCIHLPYSPSGLSHNNNVVSWPFAIFCGFCGHLGFAYVDCPYYHDVPHAHFF